VGADPAQQRGVARRPPHAGVRGCVPELHGEHDVVARQGAAVAERAEAELHGEHDVVGRQGWAVAERAEAALLVGVQVRGGGLAVPVVRRDAAAEPGRERRRVAPGIAGPAPELQGAHERCASRAVALARLSVGSGAGTSLPGSECGSSSTVGHRGSAQGAWHG